MAAVLDANATVHLVEVVRRSGAGSFNGQNTYVPAGASATTALGPTGAKGDTLAGVLVIPTTTAAGTVQIKDGTSGAITTTIFNTGTLADLKPFFIELNAVSTVGGWSLILGANVTAIGLGAFTP